MTHRPITPGHPSTRSRPPTPGRHAFLRLAVVVPALLAGVPFAAADDNPVYLQWFETRWSTMERRMPDFFVAGYDGTWLPPASKAADPTSPGYDVFDRFDLGRPGAETLYGTEGRLKAVINEFHRAGALVYVDSIMNHNSGRTENQAFFDAGGWPGFVVDLPGDFWGDFHDGSSQSHDPGGPDYDLFNGDLVGLIDIAQEENHQYIRHPVEEGDPLNIPPGTVRNRPSAGNRRFYPDRDLPGRSFTNPGVGGGLQFTVYPFNTADAAAGDAVTDNATGLLMRWSQWMVETIGVDGFRLDAAKHIPQWFWNQYWDAAVHMTRITPGGTRVTPYSFGEVFGDSAFVQSYIRRDAFADRDVLDLNGAGALRGVLDASGFGSWQDALGANIDVHDDGFNNGTQGVNHIFSHDNGSAGNGSSVPPLPDPSRYALPQHAYMLFRTGPAIVYHNGREFASLPGRGFWPREGSPAALGASDPRLTRLVQLSGGYARGLFVPINSTDPVNQAINDVLVFERRTALSPTENIATVVVAVNDRYDAGIQTRNVRVSFPPGTRLHELTGNAADPVIDPADVIAEVLIVGADGRLSDADNPANLYLRIPHNVGPTGVAHHRGYVVYGPAAPSGTLDIVGASSVLPADPPSTPSHARRLTPLDVVAGPAFDLRLTTIKTDPLDPDWDDNAVFRIDGGFRDFNGNGAVDIGEESAVTPGYENFATFRRPLVDDPAQPGLYVQTIDTSLLDEGVHYVSVRAFRRRTGGGDPIFTDFRRAIYIDRLSPQVQFHAPPGGQVASPTFDARVTALDRATDAVHIILNPPPGADPLTLINAGNRAVQDDRFEWRRSFFGLPHGENTLAVVALEPTGRSSVSTHTVFNALGSGDINRDGRVTIDDLHDAFTVPEYRVEGDLDADGDNDAADRRLLELRLRQGEAADMGAGQR